MKIKQNNMKKSLFPLVLVALTGNVFAAYCPLYSTEVVQPMFTNSTLAMNSAILSMDATLSGQLKYNSEQVLSALQILTKQKAISAHQATDTDRKAAQTYTEAINTINTQNKIAEVVRDYSPQLGQGYNACLIAEERNELATQQGAMEAEVGDQVRFVLGGPGKYVSDYAAGKDQILEDYKSNFCSQAQVDSGLCEKVGKYAGLDASIFFKPDDGSSGNLRVLRSSFINTAVGTPDAIVTKDDAKSSAAQQYLLAKTQTDALMSPAINALQNLSANYSTADTDHTGASKSSVMGQYKIQVNRYFGGTEENEKWTKTLTAQAERGLLVEQLKMKALNLSIATQKYKQYEMMESQLAALVALEVQKGAGQSAKSAANQALSNKITGAN